MLRIMAFVISCSASAALAVAQSPIMKVARIPVEYAPDHSVDQWANGYWLQYQRALHPGDHPVIWSFDDQGQPVIKKTEIWFPGAYHVILHAATAYSTGELLASVEVWKAPGDVATALVTIAPPGTITAAIRTDDLFIADAMATTANGAWLFGGDPLKLASGGEFDTIRWYSANGTVKGSYAPRSGFNEQAPQTLRPTLDGTRRVRGSSLSGNHYLYGGGRVVASSHSVAVFSAVAQTWIEFDQNGRLMSRLVIPRPSIGGMPAFLSSMAMTADGRVYASFHFEAKGAHSSYYQLDREHKAWVPVSTSDWPAGCGGIYGTEGNLLIARCDPEEYAWFDPPDGIKGSGVVATR